MDASRDSENELVLKRLHFQENDRLFSIVFASVSLLIFLYAVAYAAFGAYFSSVSLFSGLFLLAPLSLYLHRRGHGILARLLFIVSTNASVFLASLGTGHGTGAEVYCLPMTMFGLVLFDSRHSKEIIGAIGLALMNWTLITWGNGAELPVSWMSSALPVPLLHNCNFLGALIMTGIFVTMFAQSLNRLTVASLHHVVLAQTSAVNGATYHSDTIDKTDEPFVRSNLRHIVKAMNDSAVVAFIDRDGGFTEVNDEFCRISDYSGTELIGKSFSFLNWDQAVDSFHDDVLNKLASGVAWHGEIHCRRKSGDPFWLQITLIPLLENGSTIESSLAICFDVTDRNSKEHEKEALRFQLESAQRVAKVGSWTCDLETGRLTWSKQMYQLFGRTLDQGPSAFSEHQSLVHPGDVKAWKECVDRCFADGTPFKTQYRALIAGQTVWIESIGAGVHDESGELVYLYGTCQDISERILQNQDQQFILDALNIGLWNLRFDERSIEWDSRMYQLFGCEQDRSQTPQQIWEDCVSSESKTRISQEMALALRGDRLFDVSFQIKTPSGEVRYLGGRGFIIKDGKEGQAQMHGISWDKTHEQLLENEILTEKVKMENSAKMAALGAMAAGIAHEINNPLGIILLMTDRLKQRIERGEPDPSILVRDCAILKETTLRVGTIVKGLRTLSRNSEQDPFLPTDIAPMIFDTLALCQERFRNGNVKLIVDDIPSVAIDMRAAQVSQILLNLLNNGFDAISQQQAPWIRLTVNLTDSEEIQFIVSDSGGGIPEAVAKKIMDPFFTTKDVGKGTGLGLSLSQSMAQDHQGSLVLDRTQPNTSFVLTLPLKRKNNKYPPSSSAA